MTEAIPWRTRFRRTLDFGGEERDGRLHLRALLDDDDHRFWVDLVVRLEGNVLEAIDVTYERAPFGECFREGGRALKALEGQPLGFDFKQRIREALGKGAGCLHLRSLMGAFADYLGILLYANHLGVLDPDMDPAQRYARSHGFMADRCPGFALGPEPDPARLVLPDEPVSTADGDEAVDLSLVQWMLSLSYDQRLATLSSFASTFHRTADDEPQRG